MPLRQAPSASPFPAIHLRFIGGALCVVVPGAGSAGPPMPPGAAAPRGRRAAAAAEEERIGAALSVVPHAREDWPAAAARDLAWSGPEDVLVLAEAEDLCRPGLGLLEQVVRQAALARRRLELAIPPAILRRDAAHRRLERAHGSRFRPWWRRSRQLAELDEAFTGAAEEVRDLTARFAACRVPVVSEFEPPVEHAFAVLAEAHARLAGSGRIWELRGDGTARGMPAAGSPVRGGGGHGADGAAEGPVLPEGTRLPVSFGTARTGPVAADRPGLRLTDAEGAALDLFPGFCLLRGPAVPGESGAAEDPAVFDLRELRVEASVVRLMEAERVPEDAAGAVVGHGWSRLRDDGAPDLRHPDNRRLPILRYGLLRLRGPAGIDQAYVVSREEAASGFAAALAGMQAALEAAARRSAGVEGVAAAQAEGGHASGSPGASFGDAAARDGSTPAASDGPARGGVSGGPSGDGPAPADPGSPGSDLAPGDHGTRPGGRAVSVDRGMDPGGRPVLVDHGMRPGGRPAPVDRETPSSGDPTADRREVPSGVDPAVDRRGAPSGGAPAPVNREKPSGDPSSITGREPPSGGRFAATDREAPSDGRASPADHGSAVGDRLAPAERVAPSELPSGPEDQPGRSSGPDAAPDGPSEALHLGHAQRPERRRMTAAPPPALVERLQAPPPPAAPAPPRPEPCLVPPAAPLPQPEPARLRRHRRPAAERIRRRRRVRTAMLAGLGACGIVGVALTVAPRWLPEPADAPLQATGAGGGAGIGQDEPSAAAAAAALQGDRPVGPAVTAPEGGRTAGPAATDAPPGDRSADLATAVAPAAESPSAGPVPPAVEAMRPSPAGPAAEAGAARPTAKPEAERSPPARSAATPAGTERPALPLPPLPPPPEPLAAAPVVTERPALPLPPPLPPPEPQATRAVAVPAAPAASAPSTAAPPQPAAAAPATPPPAHATPGTAIDMALGANVRAAPDGSAPVLRGVGGGTRVRVFARAGGWLQIGDGTQPWGWVHASRAEGRGGAAGAE